MLRTLLLAFAGCAQVAPPRPPPSPPVPAARPVGDPLELRLDTSHHAIEVGTADAELVRPHVEKIRGISGAKLWATASDAGVTELRAANLVVKYRDWLDVMHCANVLTDPAGASRPAPPPFHDEPDSPLLVQLALPADNAGIEWSGIEYLEVNNATVIANGDPAVVAKSPIVSWVGHLGTRERVEHLVSELQLGGGCAVPDAELVALASWIERDRNAMIELDVVLVGESDRFDALVRRIGGREVGPTGLHIIWIRREALPAIAGQRDVRQLSFHHDADLT